MRHRWRLIGAIVAVVLLVAAVVGYLWLTNLVDPMPETEPALASDAEVSVSTDPWLTFTPADASTTGFIFYPGGRVPAQAYAPQARAIAAAGYVSVIVPMPFGLAVISPDAADAVIEAHPDIERWVIGGHSLGGAMAAGYADNHDAINGLALWAAYPAGDTDLTDADPLVASIYASEDGLATVDEIERFRGSTAARHGVHRDRRRQPCRLRLVRAAGWRRGSDHLPRGTAGADGPCDAGSHRSSRGALGLHAID